MKNLEQDNLSGFRMGDVSSEAYVRTAQGEAREMGKRALYEKYHGAASQDVVDDMGGLSTVIEPTLK